MILKFDKQVEDKRGKIIFCSSDNIFINIAEIKKGFSRGGHYHKYDQQHFIVKGKIEYRETDILSGKESIEIISGPALIHVQANTAHFLTALEDTIFVESFPEKYEAVNYSKYRKIIEEQIK
jgi:quercetin dioxygenase-like cupin family protein